MLAYILKAKQLAELKLQELFLLERMNIVCIDDTSDGDCLCRVLLSQSSNSGVIIPPLLVKMIALIQMVITRIQMKLMTFKDKNDDGKDLEGGQAGAHGCD